MRANIAISRNETAVLVTNKLIRNTYTLLSLTLLFSAMTCAISMGLGVGRGAGLVTSLAALGLLWFVLPKTAHSSAGLGVVFAITGLLGFGLGPVISAYLTLANGSCGSLTLAITLTPTTSRFTALLKRTCGERRSSAI